MLFTDQFIIIRGHKYDRALVERIIQLASNPLIRNIVIDGFSGIGGVTEGFDRLKDYKVIACINHWDVAIATHMRNHPDCLHLQEDFRSADIGIINYMISEIKKRNPRVAVHGWFSLECTNFSNAKGGMSRDADSRTLADHMHRYVVELNLDVIWVENVKEFMLWGPMVPKVTSMVKNKRKTIHLPLSLYLTNQVGNYCNSLIEQEHNNLSCPLLINKKEKTVGPWMIPCTYRKGKDFQRWLKEICSLGYQAEYKLLNCANFGVPQHRIRLIIQFNRNGRKASWPVQTHDKKGANGLPKWKAVRTCLDLDNEGESVLSFKMQKGKLVPRIKSGATIERLINGCNKHVIGKREQQWIVKPNSAKNNTDVSSGASINNTSSTVTCFNGLNLATTHLIDHYFGNGYTKSVDQPAGVSGTKDGISMHSVQFLSTYHSTGDGSPIDNAAPAVMTKDKYPLVTTHFMDMQYSQGQRDKSIDGESGALLGVPKQKLIGVEHLIMDTQFNNGCHTLDATAKTQTANRKHFYLVNFQWFNESFRDIDRPSNTTIASMHKAPNYLITLETGQLAIEVFEHDPPHYVRLKKYMADNGIIRVNMRMLDEVELLKIMTMPSTTKLSRSSTANKKMIGNAVPSDLVEHLGAAWKPIYTLQ